jgi:hypothetical protein
MTERTTVRLPEELVERAKRKAASEGRTLTSLIEEGLRRVLAANRPRRAAPRLRTSTAQGGFAEGIASFRDIQALDDSEDADRLRRL